MFVRRKKLNRTQQFEQFPEDFDKLGLEITEDHRLVEKDDKRPFDYNLFGTAKDEKTLRRNECRREAVDECNRQWVYKQLTTEVGLVPHHSPTISSFDEPHTTVLHTPSAFEPSNTKPLVIILPSQTADLGIFSRRQMSDVNMFSGSTIPFIKSCLGADYEVLLLNPGQCIWDPVRKRVMSESTWKCTTTTKPYLLTNANRIPGNSTVDEHLNTFLGPDGFVLQHLKKGAKDRKVLFLGISFTGTLLTYLLSEHWTHWAPYAQSLCLLEPSFAKRKLTPDFRAFLIKLGRAYIVWSGESLGERIDDMRFGCATHSGEETESDKMMCGLVDHVSAYFKGCLENSDLVNEGVMVEVEDLVGGEGIAERMKKAAFEREVDNEEKGWGFEEIEIPKGINIDDPKYD
ncbi:hypothetical protein BJ508DRAFT_413084 [Ascobolus immersus RN42]|uniref:Arb2 domain-containing protein n=1 Tax=Ascobolus immersus RN42 TaxID=1160509 RepID=A0A3N4IHB1_ASCIM|nr:hypothetical protein BJ508DRAFT_413084 [Ascobolus immersus RN42]